jgi:hypothetical protein
MTSDTVSGAISTNFKALFGTKTFFRKKISNEVSNVRLFKATEKSIMRTTKASGAILTINNAFFANYIFPKIKPFY